MHPIQLATADSHLGALASPKGRVTRLIILSLAIAAGLAIAGGLPLALSASGGSTITVCPSGPPACDFPTIQQGLQAAAAGDTLLVAPGDYQGPIELKSQVMLRSRQGAETTVILADAGPIVYAENVVSATIEGFSIDGRSIVSGAVGIQTLDSQLLIKASTIHHFQGANATTANPIGADATAVRFQGNGRLEIFDSTIEEIHGGHALDLNGSIGGTAIGLAVTGQGQVTIIRTTFASVSGGDGAMGYPYSCDSSGGDAVGISTEGVIQLVIGQSEIRDVWGGKPCNYGYCAARSGAAIGIEATGGSVLLRDNQLEHLYAWQSHGGKPGYAVHTSSTTGTVLESNSIDDLSALLPRHAETSSVNWSGKQVSPCCDPGTVTAVAIKSEGDTRLTATRNSITHLRGRGYEGRAIAVDTSGTNEVVLTNNLILDLAGGYGDAACQSKACNAGLRISQATTATVSANTTNQVIGGDGEMYCYGSGYPGGSAVGLILDSASYADVTNNTIRAVSGGKGSGDDYPYPGGDATSLYITGGGAKVFNNVLHRTEAGSGAPGAARGAGVGVQVRENAVLEFINNAVTSHDTGILATQPALAVVDYNNFWQNVTDYTGVTPGLHELHITPGFTDPANNNFLLKPGSLLIDAGRNEGAPLRDIDGDPRPLDGNDNGLAVADIGVDEFWLGLQGSAKTAAPLAVRPAGVITYQISLVNDSIRHDLPEVTVTDTLPIDANYVVGSLWSASGLYSYTAGTITWTGAVPASSRVTIWYQVVADAQLEQPYVLVNQAVLNDHIGQPWTVDATVYVNALSRYFPLVPRGGR